MPQEQPIDVPKEAIQRLLETGRAREAEGRTQYSQHFWAGYCRALEDVIEMEEQ